MSNMIGTVQLFRAAHITRNELWGLRSRHPEAFPEPGHIGPSLVWPEWTLGIVLGLLDFERQPKPEATNA